jgi:hypothetical protein
MSDLQEELNSIEQKYRNLKEINANLKDSINNKYDPNINEMIQINKNLIIENRYITVKNFNVKNINNEFEIENINLSNFNTDYWKRLIENMKYEIQYLKKEIFYISKELYQT